MQDSSTLVQYKGWLGAWMLGWDSLAGFGSGTFDSNPGGTYQSHLGQFYSRPKGVDLCYWHYNSSGSLVQNAKG